MVAPAIGEALITTAIGLAAAIPAVVFYNFIDKRVSDLLDEVEASVPEWVLVFQPRAAEAVPLTRPSHAPSASALGHGGSELSRWEPARAESVGGSSTST